MISFFIPPGNIIYRFLPYRYIVKCGTPRYRVSTTSSVPSISLPLKSITLASSPRIDKIDGKEDARLFDDLLQNECLSRCIKGRVSYLFVNLLIILLVINPMVQKKNKKNNRIKEPFN